MTTPHTCLIANDTAVSRLDFDRGHGDIKRKAAEVALRSYLGDLVEFAEQHGLNFEVVRKSATPPSTGNHTAEVNVWLTREHTRPE